MHKWRCCPQRTAESRVKRDKAGNTSASRNRTEVCESSNLITTIFSVK